MTGLDGHDGATPDPDAGAGSPSASPPPAPTLDRTPAPPLDHAAPPDPDAAFAAAIAAERRLSPLAALARRAAPVALVAGFFGVLGGPLLMAQGTGRYLVLALDVLALGAASLYFWISYVSDPPPSGT